MRINLPVAIGGWLLIYIIWTTLAIIAALVINLYKIATINLGSPELNIFFYLTSFLTLIWYIYYGIRLYALIKMKKGSIKKILPMIIGTPIFNTLILIFTAVAVTQINPMISLGESVENIFGKETIINLGCAFLISWVWFAYFKLSRRVKQIMGGDMKLINTV